MVGEGGAASSSSSFPFSKSAVEAMDAMSASSLLLRFLEAWKRVLMSSGLYGSSCGNGLGIFMSVVCVCGRLFAVKLVEGRKGGGKTYGDVEDKVMLEGLRALRRWRRVLSWGEGSMVFFVYTFFWWWEGRILGLMEKAEYY